MQKSEDYAGPDYCCYHSEVDPVWETDDEGLTADELALSLILWDLGFQAAWYRHWFDKNGNRLCHLWLVDGVPEDVPLQRCPRVGRFTVATLRKLVMGDIHFVVRSLSAQQTA